MVVGRDVYTDRIELKMRFVLEDKNAALKQRIDDLLVELAMCNDEGIEHFRKSRYCS